MGPTGSGKSTVAETVAEELDLQLVSADAFMVYKGLDIGTNKPRDAGRYELIDIVGIDDGFGVGEWVRRAQTVLQKLWEQDRGAVVVGGAGFYVRALFEEYEGLSHAPDPELRDGLMRREQEEGLESLVKELLEKAPQTAQETDLQNPVRVRRALEKLSDPRPPIKVELPAFRKAKIALDVPVDKLDEAIEARTEAMFKAGWRAEVEGLLHRGTDRNAPGFRAIGYDCIVDLVEGELELAQAKQRIVTETRQYAKRQRTWLRSEPGTRTVQVGEVSQTAFAQATREIIDYLNSPRSTDG